MLFQSAHAWKKPQAYHRDHVQGFAMFSQNEPYSECQYYFFADETYSNVQPFRTKFTNTSQVAAHIVSEQKQKPPGSLAVGTCNSIGHQWRSAPWGGTEVPVVSSSEKLVPYIYIYSYLFKQASACQPPTREICCIGPGIMDSREKELYIMLDIMYYIYVYLNMFMYILKA